MSVTIVIHEHHVDIMDGNHNIIRHTIDFGRSNAREVILDALRLGNNENGLDFDTSVTHLVERLECLEED